LKYDPRLSEQLAVAFEAISTVICMPGRDCSIGGGTQQSSSAASRSLSVLIGARGLSAAMLLTSVAITSTSPAIRRRDLSIGAPH